MAILSESVEVLAFVSSLILLLLNVHDEMQKDVALHDEVHHDEANYIVIRSIHRSMHMKYISSILHNFRVSNAGTLLDEDLGFWVKPRSKVWFSIFVMTVYDDERWVANFRLTKDALFRLSDVLMPYIIKQNTKFREAIPVKIRVATAIFKLVQGSNLNVVSEMFAIGLSTVSKVLRDVVTAVNIVFKDEIRWPNSARALQNMVAFKDYCGLPGVIGAIDGTHFSISKPSHFAEDYYYFKSNGYSIVCQAVVDRDKRFLDLFVGLPRSVNDSRVLRQSGLFRKATDGRIVEGPAVSQDGFTPYLLGDKGYPLLSWLMTPYREGRHTVLETLYQRKHKRGRSVIEHTFGILKQAFRELQYKSKLHVTFLLDVVTCCCYLHNLLLGQDEEQVQRLMEHLRNEGLENEVEDLDLPEVGIEAEPGILRAAEHMRQELGEYLGRQRHIKL